MQTCQVGNFVARGIHLITGLHSHILVSGVIGYTQQKTQRLIEQAQGLKSLVFLKCIGTQPGHHIKLFCYAGIT